MMMCTIVNYSIERKGEKYELRVWWSRRNAKQIKRRFDTRKLAQNELDRLHNESKSPADEFDLFFGDEYRAWRKANEHFSPGWQANLDSYWLELSPRLDRAKLKHVAAHLEEIRNSWSDLSQK